MATSNVYHNVPLNNGMIIQLLHANLVTMHAKYVSEMPLHVWYARMDFFY